MRIATRRRSGWLLKGLFAGAAAGLAGSVAMTVCQKAWSKASEVVNKSDNEQHESAGVQEPGQDKNEDATIKAASKVVSFAGHELRPEQKAKAASFVHYGFGTAMGALYGIVMELAPRRFRDVHPAVSGGGFGSALFVGAHEIAVPALGLSAKPNEEPLSDHFREWALHLAYGISGEMVRRQLRSRA